MSDASAPNVRKNWLSIFCLLCLSMYMHIRVHLQTGIRELPAEAACLRGGPARSAEILENESRPRSVSLACRLESKLLEKKLVNLKPS